MGVRGPIDRMIDIDFVAPSTTDGMFFFFQTANTINGTQTIWMASQMHFAALLGPTQRRFTRKTQRVTVSVSHSRILSFSDVPITIPTAVKINNVLEPIESKSIWKSF